MKDGDVTHAGPSRHGRPAGAPADRPGPRRPAVEGGTIAAELLRRVAAAGGALLLAGPALTPGGAAAQQGDTLRADPPAERDAVAPLADTVGPAAAENGPPADTLSLEEALRTALDENPDVRSARTTASAEEAARWADWGAFLPTARASLGLSRIDQTVLTFVSEEGFSERRDEPREGLAKTVGQSLSFDWTLLEGGRRIADLQAGSAAVDAARLRASEAERRSVADVKIAFLEARKQQRLAEIARQQLENRRRELERTRQRYRIAAVDRADLLGAQVEVRQAELNLLESRDAAREARRQLRVDMGERARAAATDYALGDVPPPPDPGGLDADALAARATSAHPEIRALEADIDRASAQLWGARSRYLPTLRVGFTHRRSENLGPEGDLLTFDPRDRANTFSVSASWDLFSGFQRREENARAGAELDHARIERSRRRLEIQRTVRDLVDEVERRARRVELLREQLDRAEERLELLSEQYRLGSTSFEGFQRAIDDVTRAERDLVRERHDYLAAWARLERWAGDVAPGLPSPAVEERAPGGTEDPGSADEGRRTGAEGRTSEAGGPTPGSRDPR